jgi:hypothetical protein
MYDLKLQPWERAEFLEAARLCGSWLANTQNTPERPWGAYHVAESADLGRFLEKTCLCRDYRKPAPVWLMGLYLCGLLDLAKTPVLDKQLYARAAELGARYLKSLQCFDIRWPRAIGGFYETVPGLEWSYPRDAATGACALLALYRHTGEAECLDRAERFAQWYATYGSDRNGYPWNNFDLPKGKGSVSMRGDWQAGGALIYYQLWKTTGDARWKKALRRVLDVLEEICREGAQRETGYQFHGNCRIAVGNDDFANIALLAGYDAFRQRRYLELAAARLRAALATQAPDGAFPGYGGTFVTAIELLEALDVAAATGVEVLPESEIVEPLLRAARFGLTLQDRTSPDRWLLGGVAGQANYAHARDTLHGRDTGYALQLWVRLGGFRAPMYTTVGWGKVSGQ